MQNTEENRLKYLFGMISINRKEFGGEETITRTMNSLSKSNYWEQVENSHWILFDANSKDISYLDPFRKLVEVASSKSTTGKHTHQLWTCHQLLDYSLTHYLADYIVMMEDDILFSKNWFHNLDKWLAKYAHPDIWCYSFYTPYKSVEIGYKKGKRTWKYPTVGFYGTQCVAIRYDKVKSLHECITKNPKPAFFDLNLKAWLEANNQKYILASCPSIVQHIPTTSLYSTPKHTTWFLGEDTDPCIYKDGEKMPSRMQLLNDLISSKEYRSYLEIGVGSKDTFDKIVIEQKECVDPDPRCKATHVVTSNKFFETCGHRTWDLIFIDGLHIADQVKQDIRNSLKHLNKGGTIVLHDCLPPDEDAQAIPPKKLVWTGDVWKAWSWYRMHEPNLNMYVVDIDFGCGVIEEGTQKCFPETEEVLDYKFFTENRTKLMNVVAWKDWKKMLKTPVMENSLNMPVRKLLQVMQDRILGGTSYLGIPTFKNPLDFWVYQEIIHETQPDFIIEIGNGHGGALLALAHLCDNIQKGKVIGIDLSHKAVPNKVKEHPRIALISGDAIEQFELTKRTVYGKSILVIEDSSHAYQNTLDLLRTYSKLLKSGNYYIVEDGICHHGLDVGPSPGPYEAIKTFLEENKEFESDRARESFLVTWNINGYIRKI